MKRVGYQNETKQPSAQHIDRLVPTAVAAKVAGKNSPKTGRFNLERKKCKRSIKYKRSEIWNKLPVLMRSFPSINQFSNKFKSHWVPSRFFFRGAKASSPFPIPLFSFLSSVFPPPLSTLPSLPHRAAHLNPERGFGKGCKFPQQEPQTQNNLLNVLTNTTNFGKTVSLTTPFQL